MTDDEMISMLVSFGLGITFFFIAAVSIRIFIKQRDRLLAFFSLSWIFFGGMLIMLSLSYLFPIILMQYLAYSAFAPLSLVFWFVFLDTTMNDEIRPRKVAISCVAGAFLGTINLLMPWSWNGIEWVTPIPFVNYWFVQLTNVFFSILIISYSYWSFITYKNAPSSLKKKSRVLLACGIANLFGMVIQYTNDDLLLLVQSVIIIVSMTVTTLVFRSTPQIAHLLPYRVYKLAVTSKNGPLYYTKSWATAAIDDDMLAGLISAVGTVAKNTLKDIKSGAIQEIKMTKAVLLTEMQYLPVNIVLVASKGSAALRLALEKFSAEFVKVFYDMLYDKDGFAKEIMSRDAFGDELMEPMISKYFHNIPQFIEEES